MIREVGQFEGTGSHHGVLAFSARLKSCPCYRAPFKEFFRSLCSPCVNLPQKSMAFAPERMHSQTDPQNERTKEKKSMANEKQCEEILLLIPLAIVGKHFVALRVIVAGDLNRAENAKAV